MQNLIKSVTIDMGNVFEGYRCDKCNSFIGPEQPPNKWICNNYTPNTNTLYKSKRFYKSYNHVHENISGEYLDLWSKLSEK